MFHDVFARHDPDNPLLAQARSEVLEQELDCDRLRAAFSELRAKRVDIMRIERPTPFALPLMVERLRETLSNERLSERVSRLVDELERAAAC